MSHMLNQIEHVFLKLKLENEWKSLSFSISSLKELIDLANPITVKKISDDLPMEILSKLFTSDLNNILPLIAWNNNNVEIQFSVIRIYMNFFQKSSPLTIDGKTMIYNIFRCCVINFEGNIDNLFSGKEENRL